MNFMLRTKLLLSFFYYLPITTNSRSTADSLILSANFNAQIKRAKLELLAEIPPYTSYWSYCISKNNSPASLTELLLNDYDKLINVSITTNTNATVELYGTICQDRIADKHVLTLSQYQYGFASLHPGALVPHDLRCNFNISQPLFSFDLHTPNANAAGALGITVSDEDEQAELLLGEKLADTSEQRFQRNQIIRLPLNVSHNFTIQTVVLKGAILLTINDPCANALALSIGNFSFGNKEFPLNISQYDRLAEMAKSECYDRIQSANDTFNQTMKGTARLLELGVRGLDDDNVARVLIWRALGELVPDKDQEIGALLWINSLILVLIAISVLSFVSLALRRRTARRRADCYKAQCRAALNMQVEMVNDGGNVNGGFVNGTEENGQAKSRAEKHDVPIGNDARLASASPHISAFDVTNL